MNEEPSSVSRDEALIITTEEKSKALSSTSKKDPLLTKRPQSQPQQLEDENKRSTTTGTRKEGRNLDRKRHGARNQHKTKIFVKWLLETFPQLQVNNSNDDDDDDDDDTANNNNNKLPPLVVDVAGGKGELSARLCMCHRLHVVLIDPRPANPAKCFETLVLPKLPKKWQERFVQKQDEYQQLSLHCTSRSSSSNDNDNDDESSSSFLKQTFQERFHQLVMPLTERSLTENNNHNNGNDNGNNIYSNHLHQVLQRASLLIGMHADSATEVIVDAALLYNKPFVVVPCCVFPNLFPQRYLLQRIDTPTTTTNNNNNNTVVQVRSHEQFCQYLLEKDSRFRKSILPFEGRNVAIWWDGKS